MESLPPSSRFGKISASTAPDKPEPPVRFTPAGMSQLLLWALMAPFVIAIYLPIGIAGTIRYWIEEALTPRPPR